MKGDGCPNYPATNNDKIEFIHLAPFAGTAAKCSRSSPSTTASRAPYNLRAPRTNSSGERGISIRCFELWCLGHALDVESHLRESHSSATCTHIEPPSGISSSLKS